MRLSPFIAAAISLCAAAAASAATVTTHDTLGSFQGAFAATQTHVGPSVVPRHTTSQAYTNGLTVTAETSLGSTEFFTNNAVSPARDDFGIDGALLMSGEENYNFSFASARYGFGLHFYESTVGSGTSLISGCGTASCADSTFLFTFLNGGTTVFTQSYNAPDDTLAFFGVSSSSAFDRVEMRETSGTNDNELIGEFVSSTLAPVPLPASVLLLIGGLGGLVSMRRWGRGSAA